MEAQSAPPAPAVVAVVVTHEPGPWLEESLESLRHQDYPNMSVLVIDTASVEDPTPRVAAVFPDAYIRRLEGDGGFAIASNEVLTMVQGASYYLLCHDDVVLEPAALRLLVEEAYRSNAGIATPKYLEWDSPDRLLAVGATTDRVGVLRPMVDSGELDQGQHDGVREVLVAPSGVTLVRADLFAALSGFDPTMDGFGEDRDLSWRARLVGARVIAVPSAKVRHLEATRKGRRSGPTGGAASCRNARIAETNRLRTLMTCYRWFDLLWILPVAIVWLLGEALTSLVEGHRAESWSQFGALWEMWRHPSARWRARRAVQANRQVGDSAIRRLQVRGNTRLHEFMQETLPGAAGVAARQHAGDENLFVDWEDLDVGESPFELSSDNPTTPSPLRSASAGRGVIARKWVGIVIIATLLVLLFGSRNLLGHGLPLVGQLPDTSGGWSDLWSSWWSGWQTGGLGAVAPSSPAIGFLGVGATVLFGAVGVLQKLVVVGPLVLGPIGAYRAARWWGSRRAQVAALVAYAIVPVPYNALAQGHWGGLVAFAAAPWLLSLLIRFSEDVPFTVGYRRRWAPLIGLAALTALVASVAPSFLIVVPVVGLALLAGTALVRGSGGTAMLRGSVLASVFALALLLPWVLPVLGDRVALLGPSPGPAGRLGFAQVLLFHSGPFGAGALGWFLLIAAALPLCIGNGWRLSWAARMWIVALSLFVVVWAGRRGWLPALPVEVALAPAAAALASSVSLGAAAFEQDLPGYRFGWRQLAAALAGAALGLASVQLLVASADGRWKLPSAGAASALGFLPGVQSGDYRVLWVGAPDALPLAGRQLEPGTAYGASYNGMPDLTDQWVSAPAGATTRLASDLDLVQRGLTTKLGHLLAPTGVRYIVVANHNAPVAAGSLAEPVPASLTSGLTLQTDLRAVSVGEAAYSVFENAAWSPVIAKLTGPAAAVARSGDAASRVALEHTDLTSLAPVLYGSASGSVPADSDVYDGATRNSGWRLEVGGRSVGSQPAFGWAMSFNAPSTAQATNPTEAARLTFSAPTWIRLGDVVLVLLWIAIPVLLILDRRRRSSQPPQVPPDPQWFQPISVTEPAPRHRRPRRVHAGGAPDDGMWADE